MNLTKIETNIDNSTQQYGCDYCEMNNEEQEDDACNNFEIREKLEPQDFENEKALEQQQQQQQQEMQIEEPQYYCGTSKSTRLNTRFISHRIQSFLKKNQIHKKYFCHKILGTSILLYENLIEKPKEWSKLNSMFKLYFKKMNSFINNTSEQRSFIEHVKTKETRDSQIDEKHDLIRYDISQITINGRYFCCMRNEF